MGLDNPNHTKSGPSGGRLFYTTSSAVATTSKNSERTGKSAGLSALRAIRPAIHPAGWARRFWPCVSRFSVKSPALKLSPPGPVFAKSRDCDESMDAGRWRKRKGIARVRLSDGSIHVAEVHWYEAAGIGRKEFKIKHLL
jgi:hypothetical protein